MIIERIDCRKHPDAAIFQRRNADAVGGPQLVRAIGSDGPVQYRRPGTGDVATATPSRASDAAPGRETRMRRSKCSRVQTGLRVGVAGTKV